MDKQDITPIDSVVPVYLEPISEIELQARQAEYEANELATIMREEKLQSALNKLKSLGLTESEAKIIIGLE